MTRTFVIIGVSGVLLATAVSARAATLCVKSSGGPCQTSIQAAVDAANPADAIVVAPGTYLESVVIPTGKDGLRIAGQGGVVVDPEAQTGSAAVGMTVSSSGVQLSNFTLRNGRSDGIVIGGAAAVVTNVKVLGPDGDCVRLLPGADGATIRGSVLQGCGGFGVEFGTGLATPVNGLVVTRTTIGATGGGGVNGWGGELAFSGNTLFTIGGDGLVLNAGSSPVVTRNSFRNVSGTGVSLGASDDASVSFNRFSGLGADGISILGGSAVVTSNVVEGADGVGVYTRGASPRIASNTLSGVTQEGVFCDTGSDGASITLNRISGAPDYDGIEVVGNGVEASRNTVDTASQGVFIQGNTPTIVANLITNGDSHGVHVECAPCDAGAISRNVVSEMAGGAYGLFLNLAGGSGGTEVSSNVVNHANYVGMYVAGFAGSIFGNKVFDSGYPDQGGGMQITGIDNAVSGNYVKGSGADGFFVTGSGHVLQRNVAVSNYEDGFDIHATNVTLLANTALGNVGAAFEIDAAASGASLTSNTVMGLGAVGLCNAASADTSGGNTFRTEVQPASGQCDQASGFIGN